MKKTDICYYLSITKEENSSFVVHASNQTTVEIPVAQQKTEKQQPDGKYLGRKIFPNFPEIFFSNFPENFFPNFPEIFFSNFPENFFPNFPEIFFSNFPKKFFSDSPENFPRL